MKAEAIFLPVTALALLTLAVMCHVGYKRFSAGFAGRVRGGDFRYGESANVPPDVTVVNRNYMNLLEAPVLFYVLCLVLYVTQHVTTTLVALAWTYVALRYVHTLVHLTVNRIRYRFGSFAASCMVLAGMWLWFAGTLFG